MERQPPLFVYCGYEAVSDSKGFQTPILLCLEDAESNETLSFYGRNCTKNMLDHLECLAVDMDGYDRCVIVVFHSFKGYDGMFVLEYLYKHHREDPITIRTKIFSLKWYNLTFKDSLPFCLFLWPTFLLPDGPSYVKGSFLISSAP